MKKPIGFYKRRFWPLGALMSAITIFAAGFGPNPYTNKSKDKKPDRITFGYLLSQRELKNAPVAFPAAARNMTVPIAVGQHSQDKHIATAPAIAKLPLPKPVVITHHVNPNPKECREPEAKIIEVEGVSLTLPDMEYVSGFGWRGFSSNIRGIDYCFGEGSHYLPGGWRYRYLCRRNRSVWQGRGRTSRQGRDNALRTLKRNFWSARDKFFQPATANYRSLGLSGRYRKTHKDIPTALHFEVRIDTLHFTREGIIAARAVNPFKRYQNDNSTVQAIAQSVPSGTPLPLRKSAQ